MRIDMIISFKKLVETGSYASAAAALYMNPTTLQSHIKAVEEELATPLVRFTGRRLVLTHAGTLFLLFAERILGEYEELQGQISELGRMRRTVLRVAALQGAAVHLVPPVITRFRATRPDVTVSVETTRVGGVLAALVGGEADLAIVQALHTELTHDMFTATQLLEDDLVMVVRRDLASEPLESLLATYPFVVQAPTSLSRHYVERWARSQGVKLNVAVEHNAFDGIIALVTQGNYIGVVAGYAVRESLLSGALTALNVPTFSCVRRIVALHSEPAAEVVQEFVQTFVDYYYDYGR